MDRRPDHIPRCFCRAHGIDTFDLIKADVEGAELDVVSGADSLLSKTAFGMIELEVNVGRHRAVPLFEDVLRFIRTRGYGLYDVDFHRFSRGAMPSYTEQDFRDHNGSQAFGATEYGQIVSGDAFFRKPDRARPCPTLRNIRRILRLACLLELYWLPDCAGEVLCYYKDELESIIDVTACLDGLVPDEARIDGTHDTKSTFEASSPITDGDL